MNNLSLRLLAVAGIALIAGCQAPPPPRPPVPPPLAMPAAPALEPVLRPEWRNPPTDPFRLGPGDRLEVELMGEPTTRTTTTVGPDGKIYFYLLPGVDVWGLTIAETKTKLERELTGFIRGQPQVTLTLRGVESQRVWLLGRVNSPGVYAMSGPITLLEAIAQAGGPGDGTPPPGASAVAFASFSTQDTTDYSRSYILRDGQVLPVDMQKLLHDGDPTQNIYLKADDFVYLQPSSTREVYVLGAVGQPQAVPATRPLSLIVAIAAAGGAARDANITTVAVVRGSLSSPQAAIVNLKEVMMGRAADMTLEPGDIVYVPAEPYRTLNRFVTLALETFGRTVGANAASRVTGRGVPVTVNVPLTP